MNWKDAPIPPIPGTMKSSAKNKRLVLKRNAKAKKMKSHRLHGTDKVLSLIENEITNAKFLPGRDDRQITFRQRRAVVDGYKELLSGLGATHFLTFMPGRFVRPETIVANIIKFCCRIERKALGKKWSKVMKDRIRLIGFLEKPDITPHYHAFAYVPSVTRPFLEKYGAEIWAKLMPAGKFDAPLIYNLRKILSYTTKDLHHYWSPENVVIYKPIRR